MKMQNMIKYNNLKKFKNRLLEKNDQYSQVNIYKTKNSLKFQCGISKAHSLHLGYYSSAIFQSE